MIVPPPAPLATWATPRRREPGAAGVALRPTLREARPSAFLELASAAYSDGLWYVAVSASPSPDADEPPGTSPLLPAIGRLAHSIGGARRVGALRSSQSVTAALPSIAATIALPDLAALFLEYACAAQTCAVSPVAVVSTNISSRAARISFGASHAENRHLRRRHRKSAGNGQMSRSRYPPLRGCGQAQSSLA
jgi:hypothetical protein